MRPFFVSTVHEVNDMAKNKAKGKGKGKPKPKPC